MKKQFLYFFLLSAFILTFSACDGVSQQEYNKLEAENKILKKELEEIKYGPDRLLAEAKTYFEDKDFDKTTSIISLLKEKHPVSQQAKDADQLLIQVEKAIAEKLDAERKAKEAKEEAEKERLANATKKLRTKYDEMKGITWYYDKSTPQYTNYNSFHLYMGKTKDAKPWMRFRIQYAADDWLFIESFIIKTDNKSYTISTSYSEMERDNGYGGIWEWYDVSMNEKLHNIVNDVIASKSVKIRHSGKQYHKDRTITANEKQGLQNILNAYEALGGTLSF